MTHTPTGWVCPVCHHVWSPATEECQRCPGDRPPPGPSHCPACADGRCGECLGRPCQCTHHLDGP